MVMFMAIFFGGHIHMPNFYTTQDRVFFLSLHIVNEILWYIEILKQFKVATHWTYFFNKIIMLNEVNILEIPNEYYQKQV